MRDPKLRTRGESLSGTCDPISMGKLARETGLEPATSGVTGRRSNQLSYSPAEARPDKLGASPSQGSHAAADRDNAQPQAGFKLRSSPGLELTCRQ